VQRWKHDSSVEERMEAHRTVGVREDEQCRPWSCIFSLSAAVLDAARSSALRCAAAAVSLLASSVLLSMHLIACIVQLVIRASSVARMLVLLAAVSAARVACRETERRNSTS
jgi:hypothetical protein